MKIKADFVTNSSTTVYICYVPEDFIISEEFIEKSESYNSYYDPDEDEIGDLCARANEQLKEFRRRGEMQSEPDWLSAAIIGEALDKHNYILKSIDVGGGDCTIYVSISDDEIKKLRDATTRILYHEDQVGICHQ